MYIDIEKHFDSLEDSHKEECKKRWKILQNLIKADGWPVWMTLPNSAFQDKVPLDMFLNKDFEEIDMMIYELGNSDPD